MHVRAIVPMNIEETFVSTNVVETSIPTMFVGTTVSTRFVRTKICIFIRKSILIPPKTECHDLDGRFAGRLNGCFNWCYVYQNDRLFEPLRDLLLNIK